MQLDGVVPELTWIVIVGAFMSFGVGWATGSNDVANAFATSVGAKTLTLGQAVIIAAIFEFAGCMVLGRVTTSVVAGSITEVTFFQREPEMYAYGMMCACTTTFIWNTLASYCEINVSTTHSIIGSIMGFALVYGGGDAVNWALKDPKSFPPYKGVVPIVCSWVMAPVLCALCAGILFTLTKFLVLRRPNSYQMSFWLLPFFVALTIWTCAFFIITKGAGKYLEDEGKKITTETAAWISGVCAGVCALITIGVVLPLLRRMADKEMAKRAAIEEQKAKGTYVEPTKAIDTMTPWAECNFGQKIVYVLTYGTKVDIHDVVEDDPVVAEIHRRAEQFDPKTEFAFSYLQVFSAICVMFAHGANDSAYAAGPLAGIYTVYKTGTLPKKVVPEIWILVLVGFSLVIGLATYGYNVTRAMGTRMAKLSPSRGFAAELSTAMVIMVASQYGLPTSTSQAITGSIIGVALCEGIGGLNWRFFALQFASWVGTLFVCAGVTALLFAQGVYAPGRVQGRQQVQYEDFLINMTRQIIKDVNKTIYALPSPYVVPNFASLVTKLNKTDSKVKALGAGKTHGTITSSMLIPYTEGALSLLMNNTIYKIGIDAADLDNTCSVYAGKCKVPKTYFKNVPLP